MVHVPQIKHTKDYDCFQFTKWQRPVSETHVDMFVNDPSFPTKYPTCPTVVDSDFNIVDGQHRCLAARKLNIPVYYIIDPTANVDDVRKKNMQNRPWRGRDYINFYANTGNKSYQIIQDILKKHETSLSYLNSLIIKMCNYRQLEYSYKFKDGKINVEKHETSLKELCDNLFPTLKKYRTIKGEDAARPLFRESYLYGFTHYYIKEKDVFDKCLEKLPTCGYEIPYCGSFESARVCIKKIADWKKPKEKKE